MGAALFPVLQKKIQDFDPSLEVSGKALSHHSELIDAACKQLGIKSLWDFYDESPEEMEDHLGEELSPELAETLAKETLHWFDPAEAITMIHTLRPHLSQHQDAAADAIIRDLDDLERVLNRAVQEKTRFRLALDI